MREATFSRFTAPQHAAGPDIIVATATACGCEVVVQRLERARADGGVYARRSGRGVEREY